MKTSSSLEKLLRTERIILFTKNAKSERCIETCHRNTKMPAWHQPQFIYMVKNFNINYKKHILI